MAGVMKPQQIFPQDTRFVSNHKLNIVVESSMPCGRYIKAKLIYPIYKCRNLTVCYKTIALKYHTCEYEIRCHDDF